MKKSEHLRHRYDKGQRGIFYQRNNFVCHGRQDPFDHLRQDDPEKRLHFAVA